MKKSIVIVLVFLVIMTLACNLSSNVQPPTATPEEGVVIPPDETQPVVVATEGGQAVQPSATSQPAVATATEIPSKPVSINDELASLNSYTLNISFNATGPDKKDANKITTEVKYSKDQDARQTHITTSLSSKTSSEPATGNSWIYAIGNDQCSGSDTDWSWTNLPPNQKEMLDTIKSMISVDPIIDNPTFVASESMNGIPSNHFTFKVSGLGVTSGAEVTANQGDYWLAVDGQYIVKYVLTLETRGGPNSDILHVDVAIDVTDINQPVTIAFPKSCLDIKPTATPSK